MIGAAESRVHVPPRFETLFDADNGVLSPLVYSDPVVFQAELERIFAKCWLFLAHESEIPAAGDFCTTTMGADSVVVSRQANGEIVAFLNMCRHRGVRLCVAEKGKANSFVCPYHGWTYDGAGALTYIPDDRDGRYARTDKRRWGAVRVPRLHNYFGLIFGCWDEDAESFDDYLGDMKWYLDGVFDRSAAGTEVIAGAHRWMLQANWKFAAEQFAGDSFHFATTHGSALAAIMGEATRKIPRPKLKPDGVQVSDRHGHGGGFRSDDRDSADALREIWLGADVVSAFERDRERASERLGALRGADVLGSHLTIFPNFSVLPVTHTIRVWHPRAPGETEIVSRSYVECDMDEGAKDSLRRALDRSFGSAGIFELDDSHNWSEAQQAFSGAIARRTPLNMQMSIDDPVGSDPRFPGRTQDIISENGSRGFYRRWLELLSGASEPAA